MQALLFACRITTGFIGQAGLTSRNTIHVSCFKCHTSHFTRHTSHITRHTSYATRHTSHVTRHTSHVTHHTSLAVQHAFKLRILFFVSRGSAASHCVRTGQQQPGQSPRCHTSHVTRHTSHAILQLISDLTVGCAVVRVAGGGKVTAGAADAEVNQRVESWVRSRQSRVMCDV